MKNLELEKVKGSEVASADQIALVDKALSDFVPPEIGEVLDFPFEEDKDVILQFGQSRRSF